MGWGDHFNSVPNRFRPQTNGRIQRDTFIGLLANRPLPSQRYLGYRYFASDLSNEYLCDGKQWLQTGGLPANTLTGYLYGFGLSFINTSQIRVQPGACRDKADATFLSLASALAISTGAPGTGDDSFQGAGTISQSASVTVTGTGTNFLTAFNPRATSGSISSSGTTVTGTVTNFLTEYAVDDLIGTAAKGYFRVTAIASNTSLTISSTPGSAFSGQQPNCIQRPLILFSQVDTIASDTSLTVTTSGTNSGTYRIGQIGAANRQGFVFVWVGSGPSGTTAWLSSQFTTPYGLSGYTNAVRRIGSILLDSSNAIAPFAQSGNGAFRDVSYGLTRNTDGNALLTSGTATSWADVVASSGGVPIAPRSAVQLRLQWSIVPAVAAHVIDIRTRNAGSSSTSSAVFAQGNTTATGTGNHAYIECDGAQGIQYQVSVNTDAGNIWLFGYREQL